MACMGAGHFIESIRIKWWIISTARPSGKIPAASPPSPSLQVPYPGKSAFCARLLRCSMVSSRLTFRPSPRKQVSLLASDGRHSTDYFGLCLTSALRSKPLSVLSVFLGTQGRSPQVRTLNFPAPLPHLLLRPLVISGFVFSCQLARLHSL